MIFCNGYLTFPDKILNIIKEQRKKNVPFFLKEFSLYDCIPNLKWCSGRLVKELKGDFNFDIIKKFNDNNIGIFPTLTNTVYNNIDDPLLIKTLDTLNQCNLNGVILASDILYNFIKKYYPNLKISCSITKVKPYKVISDQEIKKIESLYDFICPKQNVYLDPTFYNRINKPQYEILLNNACPWNCPNYKHHYKKVSELCIKYIDDKIKYNDFKFINKMCFFYKKSPIFDLKQLLDIGYTTFKFSLRSEPISEQISCVEKYLKNLNANS